MSGPIHYLTPGSCWMDRAFRAPANWRRTVRIIRSDGEHGGYVYALGSWQMLVGSEWKDQSPERKTRILASRFFQQYELLPADEPDPSAVGGKPKAPSEGSSDLQVVLREDGESR